MRSVTINRTGPHRVTPDCTGPAPGQIWLIISLRRLLRVELRRNSEPTVLGLQLNKHETLNTSDTNSSRSSTRVHFFRRLQILARLTPGTFKNPKDSESRRKTSKDGELCCNYENLSKLVNKIYTSAERDIWWPEVAIVECFLASFVISPSVVVFCWPSFDRLSWSSTSLYFAVLSYEKYVIVRLDTINQLLGPMATTIIQIQVIARQKFLYAIFTRQIMVWNLCNETPRYSPEVTFTL